MTLSRPADSVYGALFHALKQLDDEEILAATGLRRDSLEKKSRGAGYAGLPLEQAARLEAMLRTKCATPIFQPVFEDLVQAGLREFSNRTRPTPGSLGDKILRLNIELGRLSAEVERAQSHDSPGGAAITREEWSELLAATVTVRRAVDHLIEVAKARMAEALSPPPRT